MEPTPPSYAQGPEELNPSPVPPGALFITPAWPPLQSKGETVRRLIVIALEPGEDPELDYEGKFAWWEVVAALDKAKEIAESLEFEDTLSEARDEGESE